MLESPPCPRCGKPTPKDVHVCFPDVGEWYGADCAGKNAPGDVLLSDCVEWRRHVGPAGEPLRESFQFLFDLYDVDAAKDLLTAAPREVHAFPVEAARSYVGERGKLNLLGVAVDWDRAESDPAVDLAVPVIIVPRGTNHMVVDGWQRLARAVYRAAPSVPAVVLTAAETRQLHTALRAEPRRRARKAVRS